ncbi:fasciclin-like arabinogalactan protein 3 [Salvia divinorum]|uniref:Fasciclin-like arabinogalactan protein 3 n=1 Tax=Salvia divinorum TaxID=28513 RepID=A0ABD1HG89_SALDI
MALSLPLLLSLFISLHTANAFDVTQILNQYPEFATFNSYLTQTNLAAEINARNTITLLILDNGSLSPLSGKPVDLIRSILSVHVLLDYYDAPRLQTQAASRNLITTLFQTTGLARGQQGFLSVSSSALGSFSFGSAMPGSPLDSNLVKSVLLQPYNISILQVSSAILPQGIDGTKTSSPPSTPPPATASATPPPLATTGAIPPPLATVGVTPPPTTSPPSLPTLPPLASLLPVPSIVPPTPSAATVPTLAPPMPSNTAPLPSTAPPQTSTAPVASATTPTSSKAPLPSTAPPRPSASPVSTPTENAPGSAMAPGAEGPASEAAAGGAGAKPAAKSAATPLDYGLGVVFTMVLSSLYLASTV